MKTQSVKVRGDVIYLSNDEVWRAGYPWKQKLCRLQHTGDGFPPNKVLVMEINGFFLSVSSLDLVLRWKLLFASSVTKSLLLLEVSQVQENCLSILGLPHCRQTPYRLNHTEDLLVLGSGPVFSLMWQGVPSSGKVWLWGYLPYEHPALSLSTNVDPVWEGIRYLNKYACWEIVIA